MIKETPQTHWTETLLTPEQKALVDVLFPFRTPPLEVAQNVLLVKDPGLQLREGFHQTQSSIFLFPRDDKRLLIPVVAFNESYPCMNLWVLCSKTMAKTYECDRHWAVWLGKSILSKKSGYEDRRMSYTPQQANEYLEMAKKIKAIYADGLENRPMNLKELAALMSHFVSGFWYEYYTQTLPANITTKKDASRRVVKSLFEGLEENLAKAKTVYDKLPEEDQLLLDDSFPLVVKAKITPPHPYFSAKMVETIRSGQLNDKNRLKPTRDPLEIAARSQGVQYDEVEGIYLPDHILKTRVGQIAEGRIKQMGLKNRIKTFSDLEAERPFVYESCHARYTNFNAGKLAEFIKDKRLIPLLPFEWK